MRSLKSSSWSHWSQGRECVSVARGLWLVALPKASLSLASVGCSAWPGRPASACGIAFMEDMLLVPELGRL